MTKEEEHH